MPKYREIEMKLKVCHLTSAHSRYDTRIFIKECSSLAESYHTYLVVADGMGNEVVNEVNILDAGKSSGRLDRMINAPRRVYKVAKHIDADLYHLHDPELIPIGIKLKHLGKKVIFDAHEDLPNQVRNKHYLPKLVRKTLPTLINIFEEHTCNKFDGIIVAAEPVIKDKFLRINSNTIVVNNFPILEELASLSNHKNTPNQICYVGSLAETRGIVELIKSIKLSRHDLKLVIAGNFPNKELENRVRKLEGWNLVDFRGYVGREDIASILESSSIGMVTLHPTPSYLNSMPVKLFEYMAASIPVIASDFPLWKSIIYKAKCGICIDPLDPEKIAKAIDYLIDNPQTAAEMGEYGRQSVLSRYNWNIEKIKLLNFYNKVLEVSDD